MTSFLTIFFNKRLNFNDILYEKILFLQCNFAKRYIVLILLNYLNKKGKKYMFELVLFRLLFLLKKTSLLKTEYLFNKNESSIFILHKAFFNIMPSFKLIMKTKNNYNFISFSDLLKDHSAYFDNGSLLNEHQLSKYSKNRLNKIKSLADKKIKVNLSLNFKIIPIPLNLNNRCLKGCYFLLKALTLYKNTFNFADKLYKEICLAFYNCGCSFYLKNEVDKIACFHKANIQF